jgi:hypothetical protein
MPAKEVVTEKTVPYKVYIPVSVAAILKDIAKGKPEAWITALVIKSIKGRDK